MLARTLLAASFALAGMAQAAPLGSDGTWAVFDVAQDLSGNFGWIDIETGAALRFDFTVSVGSFGLLTVVDGGFAGDVFQVTRSPGVVLGNTSAAVNSYPDNRYLDFDGALGDSRYSRNTFTLSAGSYSIGGLLTASAVDGAGRALNSTVGGISLVTAPVPEPATVLTMLAGLGLFAALRRSRSN